MEKTARDLNREKWKAYNPDKLFAAFKVKNQGEIEKRWRNAFELARTASKILKEKYGAVKVVIFGSLADKKNFTPWSDIDLAVWGISHDDFYSAVAEITGLSPVFEIDLIDPASCNPKLVEIISREGFEI